MCDGDTNALVGLTSHAPPRASAALRLYVRIISNSSWLRSSSSTTPAHRTGTDSYKKKRIDTTQAHRHAALTGQRGGTGGRGENRGRRTRWPNTSAK
jgi:hypothetical protein